jgi:thiamine monophosphate synthase
VALDVGADLCHLGQEDFFEAGYRRVSELGLESAARRDAAQARFSASGRGSSEGGTLARRSRRVLVGLSTHAPAQAVRALAAGADYIAIGPVYATGTKPTAKPVTLEYVRWAAANVPAPWFAIGGINLANLEDVVAAGARRICVVSAILDAPDVEKACAAFKSRLPKL